MSEEKKSADVTLTKEQLETLKRIFGEDMVKRVKGLRVEQDASGKMNSIIIIN